MSETIFRNARMVLPDRIEEGDLAAAAGMIRDFGPPGHGRTGIDVDGDWLLPGLVELHTDHLEGHYAPRPGVRWNPAVAVQAHDAQIAASGITTVLDALRVGMDEDGLSAGDMRALADAITEGGRRDRLRADHFLHLRCEVSASNVMEGFELFADDPRLRLASLMDHTPGQRQFADLDAYRVYFRGQRGLTDTEFDEMVRRRRAAAGDRAGIHRAAIAGACRERGIVLASHDDATADHVAEAAGHGVTIAEFPTTIEAAAASRKAGMRVLMGAPNLVRGGSHSGNVAAGTLAGHGLLDALSSDYIPFSLLQAGFALARSVPGIGLPGAVAMVSANPARAAGLDDRGSIAIGRRADLIQVRLDGDVPVVRAVWRQGRRVA